MHYFFIYLLTFISSVISANTSYIHDTIFNNSQLSYSNITSLLPVQNKTLLLEKNKNTQVIFKSIASLENFAFYMTISQKDKTGQPLENEIMKGIWMWLFIESIVKRTDYIDTLEEDYFRGAYSGYGIKLNNKYMIAIRSNLNEVLNTFQFSDESPEWNKHVIDISKFQHGIYLRISRFAELMYFEISKNGKDFEIWFIDDFENPKKRTTGVKWRMELNSNLKNEEISYELSDVYSMDYYSSKMLRQEEREIIINVNDRIHNNNITEQLNSLSLFIGNFTKMVYDTTESTKKQIDLLQEDSVENIEKLKRWNDVIKQLRHDKDTVNTANTWSEIMSLLKDITWYKHNLVNEDAKANPEGETTIQLLNLMKKQQHEMNVTLNSIQKVLRWSVNDMNEKIESLGNKQWMNKWIIVFGIVIWVSLGLIYRKVNANDVIGLAKKDIIKTNNRKLNNDQIQVV